MMKNPIKIPTKVVSAYHKSVFTIQKHSPEILIVAGIVGVVTSGVLACRATLKAKEILDSAKEDLELIDNALNDEEREEYTEEVAKNDINLTYVQTGVKLVKVYAPSVLLGTVSIFSMVASHNILRKRNLALVAAYTTLDKTFKDYRKEVIDRFGETVDKELRYKLRKEKVQETVVNEKNGKEKVVEKEVELTELEKEGYSKYARFFDESCEGWTKDAEYNLMYLRQVQSYANDVLRLKGRLFLNDVYKMLDIEPTRAGQAVGWVYDPNDATKDNYVDFGLYDTHKRSSRNFVNGFERVVILDFNVDSVVIDTLN